MIGGFSWVHLIWLADVTVRLQVSNYNSTQLLVNNKVVNAPIKFEEILIVMTKNVIFFLLFCLKLLSWQ